MCFDERADRRETRRSRERRNTYDEEGPEDEDRGNKIIARRVGAHLFGVTTRRAIILFPLSEDEGPERGVWEGVGY
jgi:hypothetical protein